MGPCAAAKRSARPQGMNLVVGGSLGWGQSLCAPTEQLQLA